MKNVYEVIYDEESKVNLVVIRRKPSQIPGNLDLDLIRAAGTAFLDGPNNIVVYKCYRDESLEKCEKILAGFLWEKVDSVIDSKE